jgi:predicted amidohydrolase
LPRNITIAAAQYPLDPLVNLLDYRAKITRWVENAVQHNASVLVFPEYGSMELCNIGNRGRDLPDSIRAVSDLTDEIKALHSSLATKHGIMIVSGSGPFQRAAMTFNVAHIFGPRGRIESFTKIMPTPWERDPWKVSAGRELKVFTFAGVSIGLLICYDIEFPLLSRALAEAGAEIILAPSNTETLWGYWRVRTGAAARALENQVFTVQAPVVGLAPFCAACETNVGAAGFFAPQDRGFPVDGVLALGEINKPEWLVQQLNLDLLADVRETGAVRTFANWKEQPGWQALPKAQLIDISLRGNS